MKFFVVVEPGAQGMDSLLKNIYDLYVDYVLKNPFYEVEMPIRCELFVPIRSERKTDVWCQITYSKLRFQKSLPC